MGAAAVDVAAVLMIPLSDNCARARHEKYLLEPNVSPGPSAILSLKLGAGAPPSAVHIEQLVVAGWTGRDKRAVEEHIRELEALGVKRPATTPIFYRVAVSRLTLADSIQAIGTRSSGEVELLLLQSAGRLWVGVGSDHTDREVETYGVAVSKQMCEKPIAMQFWAFDEVKPTGTACSCARASKNTARRFSIRRASLPRSSSRAS